MPESAHFRLAPSTATLETFEAQLREALAHLYDPDYRPSPLVAAAAGCDLRAGVLAVQSALTRAIEQLRPADEAPALARTTRNYQLLRNRFVLKLTVEETADRMVMSPSSVRRSQREAVHWLARYLWEQYCAREQTVEEWGSDSSQEGLAVARQVQVERDLASLQAETPGLVARIADAVTGMDARGRARYRASLRQGEERHSRDRVAVHGALRQGDQRSQEAAQRGDPGAQLPDA